MSIIFLREKSKSLNGINTGMTMRRFMTLIESALRPSLVEDVGTSYWTPDKIDWIAKYAQNQIFKTEQAAKDWVFHKLEHWERQFSFGKKMGTENNRLIADAVPVYMSGKSFKLGKRVRKPKLSWKDIDIEKPSLIPLINAGFINPFDGYKVRGMKLLRTATLHMTEDHSYTENGVNRVYQYAHRIKEDQTFLAIVVSQDGTILDGHHRFRAVQDVLKWKTIPCLVVELGDGE